MQRRPGAALVIAVLAMVVGMLAASQLSDRVRWVDIVTLFGSGFGAGAGLVAAMVRMRPDRPVGPP
jgi:hypothetical protein